MTSGRLRLRPHRAKPQAAEGARNVWANADDWRGDTLRSLFVCGDTSRFTSSIGANVVNTFATTSDETRKRGVVSRAAVTDGAARNRGKRSTIE